MTERERYVEALTFGSPDRIPLMPGGPRRSTPRRWRAERLPEGVDAVRHILESLGIDPGSMAEISPWAEHQRPLLAAAGRPTA